MPSAFVGTGGPRPTRHAVVRSEAVVVRRLRTIDVVERRSFGRPVTDDRAPAQVRARRRPEPRSPDRAAAASMPLRRPDLVLGGPSRAGRPSQRSVAPVPTVYRQARSGGAEPRSLPPAPPPAVPPAPVVDIDHLDRELWRRFEKRARTERERRGRA
jgi:hypothetical protein